MRELTLYTLLLIVFLLMTVCGWGWAVYDMLISWKQYQTLTISSTLAIFAVRWTLVLLGFLVFARGFRQIGIAQFARSRPHSADWLVIRMAFYCLLPPFIVTSFLHLEGLNLLEGNAFLVRSIFYSTLWLSFVAWLFWVLSRFSQSPSPRPNVRWMRVVDILCLNLVIFLFAGEGMLIGFNAIRPSMLLYSRSSDILTRMDALRFGPGVEYFNFRMNSQGYHDEEFFTATSSDLVIGLLADSFGLGVVPYEYNFVTIAERDIQPRFANTYDRIAIHNFGVPAIAMNEYAFLLESEVLPTKPSFVVLCLFMGNDIIESQGFGELTSSRYYFQNWFLWLLPKRLMSLLKEQQRQHRQQQHLNLLEIGRLTDDGDLPDYIFDSSKERPSMSPEKFLELEQWRFEVCNPDNRQWQRGFEGVFAGLRYFQQRLGHKLIVMLLPDEFQVNDELYEKMLAMNPVYASYQREYPQQRILAFCKEQNIRCFDALPALRKGQQTDRTYHLRDTHLNAYGNKIVGNILARELVGVIAKTPQ